MPRFASQEGVVSGDFRVGPWIVRPSLNTVSQNGTNTRLEPKVMEVLVCLASQAGEPVSKEVILKTVWPETFVSDDVLIRSISELRRVFDDDAKDPRFIQTIPKRGYRLVAPVELADGSSAGYAAAHSGHPAEGGSQRTKWIAGGVVLIALALIMGFLFVGNVGGVRDRLLGRGAAPAIHSVAVLPLENLSGDPGQEYFADGMTEELITELSRSSALRVISRTSMMRYKKTDKSLPQIARELGVDAVVEGSVLRSGDRVRVTAQLIYAPKDFHLWAQSYEREMKDVLILQGEIASAIATQVQAQLTSGTRASPPTVDPKAYEAYLKGAYYWSRYTGPDVNLSIEYFQQAAALDPSYARAYSGLGDAYLTLVTLDLVPPAKLQEAESLERKAMQLDPSLAGPHVGLAWIKIQSWDAPGGEQEAERALELDPNNLDAHIVQMWALLLRSSPKSSMPDWRQVRQLDPVSPPSLASVGSLLVSSRMFDDGLELCHEAVELEPDFALGHWCIGRAFLGKKQPDRAIPELRQAVAKAGEISFFRGSLGEAYAAAGNRDAVLGMIADFQSKKDPRLYYEIATLEAALGNGEAALNWLDKAYKQHNRKLAFMSLESAFDPLRSDPRFQDLLGRVGLPH